MFAVTLAVIATLVVVILFSAVRILREYERGVVFTLGRYTGTKGPGFFLLVPLVQTEAWGIKVSNVEIKRIDLDGSMVRAIARQAEAERSRRAKIINAQGEQQAAQKLLDAAQILAPVPQAMQLRYLATLFDIASERSSTIVFPFPIDLITAATQR
jgi:regulator of protease activity HflC (stomatin/prohibitin superfamily)